MPKIRSTIVTSAATAFAAAAVVSGATPQERAADIVSELGQFRLFPRCTHNNFPYFPSLRQVSKMSLDEKISFAWGKVGSYVGMVPADGPLESLGIP